MMGAQRIAPFAFCFFRLSRVSVLVQGSGLPETADQAGRLQPFRRLMGAEGQGGPLLVPVSYEALC